MTQGEEVASKCTNSIERGISMRQKGVGDFRLNIF